MLCTGFAITYANCPIYWASCLWTEIALSTAEAEYIAMSSALCKVIPLITLMKELHTIFPVHIRYGARVGGSKSNAVNPILRLFLYHILHTMSL
jgi:hypothetical protein